jgi:hypothetical protein
VVIGDDLPPRCVRCHSTFALDPAELLCQHCQRDSRATAATQPSADTPPGVVSHVDRSIPDHDR